MKDLVILAADKDMKTALDALLSRDRALGIRPIRHDVFTHPGHDPACAREGVSFLEPFSAQYRHALLMFDYEGSGMEQNCTPAELQSSLDEAFTRGAWGANAKTVLLYPELEAWVWSDSPHVESEIRWNDSRVSLTDWMIQKQWLSQGQVKPPRPKEALDAALHRAGQPHSASLFGRLASTISFQRCADPSFRYFLQTLHKWFSKEE